LQNEIRDQKSRQFLHHKCNHSEMENQIQTLRTELDEGRWRPAAPGTDEDLR
jgi:hypothetical protein